MKWNEKLNIIVIAINYTQLTVLKSCTGCRIFHLEPAHLLHFLSLLFLLEFVSKEWFFLGGRWMILSYVYHSSSWALRLRMSVAFIVILCALQYDQILVISQYHSYSVFPSCFHCICLQIHVLPPIHLLCQAQDGWIHNHSRFLDFAQDLTWTSQEAVCQF